jgi:hypothetical protein
MTLDEFQTRLRAACDAHVKRTLEGQAGYQADVDLLFGEAKGLFDAMPEAASAVAGAEIARMQKAFG